MRDFLLKNRTTSNSRSSTDTRPIETSASFNRALGANPECLRDFWLSAGVLPTSKLPTT